MPTTLRHPVGPRRPPVPESGHRLRSPWGRLAAIGLTVLLLAGCIRSDPSRLYMLGPSEDTGIEVPLAVDHHSADLLIGVGPVQVPDYLDRPEMVRRISPSEVLLAEFHQWAEPIDASIASALTVNLRKVLGTHRIVAFPWSPTLNPDICVRIDVRRFDADPEGNVMLAVDAIVTETATRSSTLTIHEVAVPSLGGEYGRIAEAHGVAITRLARRLAESLRAAVGQDESK